MPDLSIIIATYNRRRTVECILRALERQSLPGMLTVPAAGFWAHPATVTGRKHHKGI
jgi:hypothetical protein